MAKKYNTGGSVIPGRTKKLTDASLLLFIIVIAFVVMYIRAMLFLKRGFLRPQIFFNILNANAALIITSCDTSLVMITGGIDIFVGSVVALVSMGCAAYLDYQGDDVPTSLPTALGISLAFGAVQGFLVAHLDIQPFIVSLAGTFFARGMTTIAHTAPFNTADEAFSALKDVGINIPGLETVNEPGKYVNTYMEIGVIVAVLMVIALFCVLKWTKLGHNLCAVDGNRQSALILGISVKRTGFLSHLLYELLVGIGGYVCLLYVGSGSASHAGSVEMNAVASSIIGGTLLAEGVGNIFGTFVGILSLSTIRGIMFSIGLDQVWWAEITVTGVLCAFLVVQSMILTCKH